MSSIGRIVGGETPPLTSEDKVIICLPSFDIMKTQTAFCLLDLHAHMFLTPPVEGMGLMITSHQSSIIQTSREWLAQNALKKGADWILWIDSDMTFPHDALHEMLKHRKPLVGTNYCKRGFPATSNTVNMRNGQMITGPDSTGLEQAKSAGFGCMLMHTDVFRHLSRPWFDVVWLRNEQGEVFQHVGEDVFFFRKAKAELGLDLFIDHDVSQYIGHLGEYEFTNKLAHDYHRDIGKDESEAQGDPGERVVGIND